MSKPCLPRLPWIVAIWLGSAGVVIFGYTAILEGWVAVTPLAPEEAELAEWYSQASAAAFGFCLLVAFVGTVRLIRRHRQPERMIR